MLRHQWRHIVHLSERLHKVMILGTATLTLHPTAVLAVVFQRWSHRQGMIQRRAGRRGMIDHRLVTLLALQTGLAARCRGKHVVRVHRADQQSRAGPDAVAVTAAQ